MLLNRKNPHGGDIYHNKVRLDFSANINPAGMPDAVRNALRDAALSCTAYPDPYCTALREKLAGAERVPEGWILCGNGAAELIYQFAYALPRSKPVLIVSPAFCEYGQALQAAGIGAAHYLMREEDGLRLTDSFLRTDFSGSFITARSIVRNDESDDAISFTAAAVIPFREQDTVIIIRILFFPAYAAISVQCLQFFRF